MSDCKMGPIPPQVPGQINANSVEIYEFSLDENNNLFLNASWSDPTEPYGNISWYRIQILEQAISPGQEVPLSQLVHRHIFEAVSSIYTSLYAI